MLFDFIFFLHCPKCMRFLKLFNAIFDIVLVYFLTSSSTFSCCQAFESPHTHGSCFSFLRQYADDSFSRAACIVVPKSIISYPQVQSSVLTSIWLGSISYHIIRFFPVLGYLHFYQESSSVAFCDAFIHFLSSGEFLLQPRSFYSQLSCNY